MPLPSVFRFIVLTRVLEKAQTKPQLPVHRTNPIRLWHASLQSFLFLNRFVLLAPKRSAACAGGLTGSENRFVVSPPKGKLLFYYKRLYPRRLCHYIDYRLDLASFQVILITSFLTNSKLSSHFSMIAIEMHSLLIFQVTFIFIPYILPCI